MSCDDVWLVRLVDRELSRSQALGRAEAVSKFRSDERLVETFVHRPSLPGRADIRLAFWLWSCRPSLKPSSMTTDRVRTKEVPAGERMVEEPLEATRWRRYGKDRLYVAHSDGTKIGWWDLQADAGHAEEEIHAEALATAVERWRRENGERPQPAAEPPPEPTAERPWLDLAQNGAGAEVRAQAVRARAAAPVRTFAARAFGVHTEERAWRLGADGEEKVAAQFDKLLKKDPRWQFIHSIPVGSRGSDIDHLVVGPGGVFTANTKNHPNAKIWVGGDTLMVNGQRQPYVRNARHEAARASKLLSQACGWPVHVEGVIVLVNAIEWEIKTPPRDVHVVPRRQIARWLLQHGEVLDQARQDAVFDAARRSTTWR